jgi:hypothetical protein
VWQIYYTGKYQSLGIKQGGPSAGKWVELPVTKSPKIVQFSVGHDGSHALLVAEDGSVQIQEEGPRPGETEGGPLEGRPSEGGPPEGASPYDPSQSECSPPRPCPRTCWETSLRWPPSTWR